MAYIVKYTLCFYPDHILLVLAIVLYIGHRFCNISHIDKLLKLNKILRCTAIPQKQKHHTIPAEVLPNDSEALLGEYLNSGNTKIGKSRNVYLNYTFFRASWNSF